MRDFFTQKKGAKNGTETPFNSDYQQIVKHALTFNPMKNTPVDTSTHSGESFFTKPFSTITNLLARFKWSVAHHGPQLGSLAIEAIEGPIQFLGVGLKKNSFESQAIESQSASLAETFRRIAADGVIDPSEKRAMIREISGLRPLVKKHRINAGLLEQ